MILSFNHLRTEVKEIENRCTILKLNTPTNKFFEMKKQIYDPLKTIKKNI